MLYDWFRLGGTIRFANHSNKPNCQVCKDSLDPTLPLLPPILVLVWVLVILLDSRILDYL